MAKPEEKRPNEISEVVGFWLDEIKASKDREKDFRKEGQRVLDMYSGRKHKSTPFNILYSNTETLLPALFSQVPRPVVQRRFKDEDPLGKAAALAAQRALEFMLDTNVEGSETFGEGKTSELVCVDTKSWNRVYFGYAKKWSKVPWMAYEEYIDVEEARRLFGDVS